MELFRAAVAVFVLNGAVFLLADAKSEIQANYDAMSKAFQKKDVNGALKFLVPDYTLEALDGTKVARIRVAEATKQQMARMTNTSWTRKVNKVTTLGKDSLAAVQGQMRGEIKDQQGTVHKMVMDTTSEDLWTKGQKGWMLKHTKIVKREVSIDGKKQTAKPPH